MRPEGLARLAGAEHQQLAAALAEHRSQVISVDEGVFAHWPHPVAPTLKDFLDEHPATRCGVATLGGGECTGSHDAAVNALRLGGHVRMSSPAVPALEAWRSALADELCGGRTHHVEVTLSVSSAGAGMPWHHDSALALLVLQLVGDKTWWLTPAAGELHPEALGHNDPRLRGNTQTPEERAALSSRLDAGAEVLHMRPGTLAVVPPYVWHRTRAETESWGLVFAIHRGGYAISEWTQLAPLLSLREEMWVELEDYAPERIAPALEARLQACYAACLEGRGSDLLDPRTVLRVREDARLWLRRTPTGRWSLTTEAKGDRRELLISKNFVAISRWLGTHAEPFSGYLARAMGPSLPGRYTDRLLLTLLERGVLERVEVGDAL